MNRTVIVFLEDEILAATGQEGRYPRLDRVKRVRLQGQGDSFDRWQQALKTLPEEWRTAPAHLVLPAGMCAARVLKLPYGKGRQLQAMALREVGDSFRSETADYSVIGSDKKEGVEICAGGADPGQLEHFERICLEAGFAVAGMTVPMEGYLQVLRQLDSYWDDTAVYLFFEEGGMTSILCQSGHYLYSGRSRLFSEPGTLDFGTEIVRSLSGILQFYASARGEAPITDVYYTGCPDADFEVSREGIEGLGLKAVPLAPDGRIVLPPGEAASDWISCVGALIGGGRKEKKINLYETNKRQSQGKAGSGGTLRHLIVPAAVFVLCLIPIIVVAVLNLKAGYEIGRKQDWIASDEVQEQYGRARELEERLAGVGSSIAAVEQTDANLASYPPLTTELLNRIRGAGGSGIECTVTGYDVSTGIITFEAASREVIDVPAYIQKLQDSGVFHFVDYLGYSYENDWYTLALSCAIEGRNVQGGDAK